MSEGVSDWVVVGKIGKPQGIQGLVRINSFTDPRENILSFPEWTLELDGKHISAKRIEEKVTPQYIAAKIEGFETREDVVNLTHAQVLIPKSDLKELGPDEYYWHELEGMKVLHESGVDMGVIDHIISTGANDVLVVIGEKKRLIPYLLDEVILEISKTRGEMTVRWDLDF